MHGSTAPAGEWGRGDLLITNPLKTAARRRLDPLPVARDCWCFRQMCPLPQITSQWCCSWQGCLLSTLCLELEVSTVLQLAGLPSPTLCLELKSLFSSVYQKIS